MSLIGNILAKSAEGIINSVGKAFNDNFTNKEERLAAQLNLEKEVNRHLEEMLERAVKQEEMYLKDVEGARQMQAEALKQTDLFAKRYIYYLGSFIILASFIFGILLFFINVPEQNKRLVEMFSDVFLLASGVTVINFFFGSSKGSADKQKTIENRL